MYFSFDLVELAFRNLVKLDSSEGKARQEKVSGLRYFLAINKLMKKYTTDSIDLTVESPHRQEFIDTVGEIVALNDQGLYTIDFNSDFKTNINYGVSSNFLTTRLANSRSSDIGYPGRPKPLLLLSKEHVNLSEDYDEALKNSFGIPQIKASLAIWLLRNEKIDVQITKSNQIHEFLKNKLLKIYTKEVALIITPTLAEIDHLLKGFKAKFLSNSKPELSNLANGSNATIQDTQNLNAKPNELPTIYSLENNLEDNDSIYLIVNKLLSRGAKGILFSGPPGTSKTWYALKIALKIVEGDSKRFERVQFHPSFSYEDFIEGLVSTGSIGSDTPLFSAKQKIFLNFCDKARDDSDSSYIFVIDEFSRGDPSKIFGELLTYIESDYRDVLFKLPYSEKDVSIPPNVIIFATMNPYDKSVADLDSAMERRFEVIELNPSVPLLKNLLSDTGIPKEILGKIIQFFNTANNLSPHGFGHTYFKNIRNIDDLVILWNHKLKFIFKKMFHFKEDAYLLIRSSFINIVGTEAADDIT